MRVSLLLTLGLLLAALLNAAPAAAQNRFNLVNSTGQTIERVHVSPARISSRGRDVLGDGVLPPGRSIWIVPQLSDCVPVIKVVYQGGSTPVGLPAGGACTVDICVANADGRAIGRRGVETCPVRELNFR